MENGVDVTEDKFFKAQINLFLIIQMLVLF